MANWPATLPQRFESFGFSYRPEDNVIRTKMAQGPVKSRVRFTAVSTMVSGNIVVDRDQVDDLLGFYRFTTSYGVYPFDWVDPISEAAAQFRFLSPPSVVDVEGPRVVVGLDLEMLP
jgi:hypothetical protein